MLLGEAERRLREAGTETARLDARLLLQHAAGLDHAALLTEPDAGVEAAAAAAFRALIEARAGGAPVAHITGCREFWGLAFETGPGALVPRPDTETLVEAMLARLPADAQIADLGTGTGCILAALLVERPCARGIGVDMAPRALALARRNLQTHATGRAIAVQGFWAEPLAPLFDAIVSNPPYIETGALRALPREVRRDPQRALDGGADGLDAYRALLPSAHRALRSGGWVGLEVGAGQAGAVLALAGQAGFGSLGTAPDLAGIARVVLGRKP